MTKCQYLILMNLYNLLIKGVAQHKFSIEVSGWGMEA